VSAWARQKRIPNTAKQRLLLQKVVERFCQERFGTDIQVSPRFSWSSAWFPVWRLSPFGSDSTVGARDA